MKIDDKFVNQYWLKSFNLSKNSRANWLVKAEELYLASRYLYKIAERAKKEMIKLINEEYTQNRGLKSGSRPMTKKEVRILRDTRLHQISLLLVGFALENLVKGILNHYHKRYFSKIFDKHLNIEMVAKCGISLRSDEKIVIDKLRKYIDWLGRYAIPKNSRGLMPVRGRGHERLYSGDIPVANEARVIENLYSRLFDKLRAG